MLPDSKLVKKRTSDGSLFCFEDALSEVSLSRLACHEKIETLLCLKSCHSLFVRDVCQNTSNQVSKFSALLHFYFLLFPPRSESNPGNGGFSDKFELLLATFSDPILEVFPNKSL